MKKRFTWLTAGLIGVVGVVIGIAIGFAVSEFVHEIKDHIRRDYEAIEFKDKQITTTDDIISDGEGADKEKNVKPESDGNVQKEVDQSVFIGEEAAKNIALEKAGLSVDDVRFVKTRLEFDDGVWYYDIEFSKDREEYEAEIRAEDGKILEWNKDID